MDQNYYDPPGGGFNWNIVTALIVWLFLWALIVFGIGGALVCLTDCGVPQAPPALHEVTSITVTPLPVDPNSEMKFCTPDYEYGLDEIPEPSARCAPLPLGKCWDLIDRTHPTWQRRCPGRI